MKYFNLLRFKYLVLIKPPVHVSTAEAYAGIVPVQPAVSLQQLLETHALADWKRVIKNDFEESVFKKYPVIADLKDTLYKHDAIYASMSGSGASVFGIFEREVAIAIPDGYTSWNGLLP